MKKKKKLIKDRYKKQEDMKKQCVYERERETQ